MKKSELRKIIRESIKGLMTEQLGPDCRGAYVSAACGPNNGNPYQGTQNYRGWHTTNQGLVVGINTFTGNPGVICLKLNGLDIDSTNVGDLFYAPAPYPNGPMGGVYPSVFAGGSECDVYEITGIWGDDNGIYGQPYTDILNGVPSSCGNAATPCVIGATPAPPVAILDCNDPAATNYNSAAYGCDNGSGFCDDNTATGYNPVICKDNDSCCVYPPNTPPKPNDPKDSKDGKEDKVKPEPTVPPGKEIPSIGTGREPLKERFQKLAKIIKK